MECPPITRPRAKICSEKRGRRRKKSGGFPGPGNGLRRPEGQGREESGDRKETRLARPPKRGLGVGGWLGGGANRTSLCGGEDFATTTRFRRLWAWQKE